MNADPLSPNVRALLDARIDSVTQLDILLLVHGGPGRAWTAQPVAAELRIGEAWAEEQLALLAKRGLLQRDGPAYRSGPLPDLADAVDGLARAYQTHPVAVVAAIYARPDRALRNFADAFRLRKDAAPGDRPEAGEAARPPPSAPDPPRDAEPPDQAEPRKA